MAEDTVEREDHLSTNNAPGPLTEKINITNVAGAYHNHSIVHITNRYEEASREDNIEEEILSWLKPPDFRAIYEVALEQRLGDTGNWFIQADEFRCWEKSKGSVLWVTGIPGSGKTVVGSIIVKHLEGKYQRDGVVGVAFAFLRYSEMQPGLTILAGLLSQLVEAHRLAYAELHSVYIQLKRNAGTTPRKQDILPVFHTVIAKLSKVFIVIDGFDEVDDVAKNDLMEWLPNRGANLLILSRQLEHFTVKTAVRLNLRAHDNDIDLYITGRILHDKRLQAILEEIPGTEAQLREHIKKKFLVAKLQMDSIVANSNSVNDLFKALKDLPIGVEEMYAHTLQRINAGVAADARVAHRVFALLLQVLKEPKTPRAYRLPPSVDDIRHAVAVDLEERTLDRGNLTPLSLIISACCGLVIEEETFSHAYSNQDRYNTLRFVHHSTREYLEKANIHSPAPDLAQVLELVAELANTSPSIGNTVLKLAASTLDPPQDRKDVIASLVNTPLPRTCAAQEASSQGPLTSKEVEGQDPQQSGSRNEQAKSNVSLHAWIQVDLDTRGSYSYTSVDRVSSKADTGVRQVEEAAKKVAVEYTPENRRTRNRRKTRYSQDPLLQGGRENDVIIPIMGQIKAGKSSLINALLSEDRVPVGKEMVSCTTQLQAAVVDQASSAYKELNKALGGRRLIFLDTPGFDDTDMSDDEVLIRIANWLEASYRKDMHVAGVLYLHDITKDGWAGTSKRNLALFTKICGKDAMSQVAFVTTKWGNLEKVDDAIARIRELRTRHWKPLIEAGAHICHLQPEAGETLKIGSQKTQDPWDIIRHLVVGMNALSVRDYILAIQDELAKKRRFLIESEAEKELRVSLQTLLARTKELQREGMEDARGDIRSREVLEKRQMEIDRMVLQLANLQPSISKRLKRWFATIFG